MYKVLIADDEAIIRKGLRQLINWQDLGFEVIAEAANGKEALRLIKSKNPDLCLFDIRMPNVHGLEAIKQAKENGFNGKFIILSGFSEFTYAQEAIKLGVSYYLTKPVDEDELRKALIEIRDVLNAEKEASYSNSLLRENAKKALMKEFIAGIIPPSDALFTNLSLKDDLYQVILFEKYSIETSDVAYNFLDLLQITSQTGSDFENVAIDGYNTILLKGSSSIAKFENIVAKYSSDLPPEKNSPLDTVFLTCGRKTCNKEEIPASFHDAKNLLNKRFFCDQYQHIVIYQEGSESSKPGNQLSVNEIMDTYTGTLVNHIQAYNRNKIAETLHELQEDLYNANLSTEVEKNLLVDLYLHIKEKIFFLYKASNIPFMANSEAINIILNCVYLYEIISFLSKQFEMIMNSIGYSSRDSIIDDIVHYIDHNYPENITLENIAPLFGYNSSYLGKIFSKKIGINFNTYLDNIRIEHSKELLIKNKIQVYKIAEMVGYRNVDYFHIKFKKSTGMSPAEYRKKKQAEG